MRRFRVLSVAVCLLALGLAASCGLPSDGSPREIAAEKVPFDIVSPTTTPSDAEGSRFADLYFVQDGFLKPERRRVSAVTPDAVLEALVQTAPPQGESSPVQGMTIKATRLDPSTSTLDVTLGLEIDAVAAGEVQKLMFGQLVYTATQLDEVSSVRFFKEGQDGPLSPPTDTGNVQGAVGRSSYRLISPTTTTSPTTSTTAPGQTTTTRPRDSG